MKKICFSSHRLSDAHKSCLRWSRFIGTVGTIWNNWWQRKRWLQNRGFQSKRYSISKDTFRDMICINSIQLYQRYQRNGTTLPPFLLSLSHPLHISSQKRVGTIYMSSYVDAKLHVYDMRWTFYMHINVWICWAKEGFHVKPLDMLMMMILKRMAGRMSIDTDST